jgi:hypothetical protein
LKALKAAIKSKADKGMCALRHYEKPEQICKLLLEDLKTAINCDFPLIGYDYKKEKKRNDSAHAI